MRLDRRSVSTLSRRIWQTWEHATSNPTKGQQNFLSQLLRRNQSTVFGKEHGFASIQNIDDYRRQVPIADYERFRPYVEQISAGARRVLTREQPFMFTLTSGTTGEAKLIPVTKAAQTIHGKLTTLWYCRAFLDHKRCFDGKVLGVVSPSVEGLTRAGIPYGSASALIYGSSPPWVKRRRAIPNEVSEIKDFTAKYYVTMRLGVEQDISFFGTPNPSTILKLVETADRFKEEIVKDIREGGISHHFELADDIRQKLVSRLSANPKRSKELDRFVSEGQNLRPAEYWPRLKLIGCWKGGTVGVRLREFDRWFAKETPVRDLGYMASEAQISLPISDRGAAGILAIDANFYEFIPETEIGGANPTMLTCTELDEGGTYHIVLTTPGGLYRYDINDVVRVTGFYNQTPLIEFIRKGRDVSNITGEKLHVNQIIQAMEHAQSAAGLTVQHYRSFADLEKSRYTFLVEFDGATLPKEALSCLLNELDSRLHQLNVEYAQKRESRRLAAPVLWVMKSGWFDAKARSTLQRAGGVQFKSQLLTTVPEDPSEALLIIEKTSEELK